MTDKSLMSAQEAADELGVKIGTIYAYVSRGLIRSRASEEGQRNRQYSREDVTRLLVRRQMRVSLDPAAKDVFQWAAPVLETGISLIEDGHLYYCGIPIEQVAMMFSAEELASLVWTENAANAHALFDSGRHPSVKKYRKKLLDLGIDRDNLFSVPSFQIILPIAMADDPIAFDLREESIALSGARILRLLTSLAAGDVAEDISLAEMLQRGWQPHDERSIRFFNMALIICADHQVKLATFSARVAAALGTTPYSVINTGITALAGPQQGGYTETVEVFLDEVKTPDNAVDVISSRLRRSESFPVPGFHNPLYPEGDPRARILLNALYEEYPDSPAIVLAQSIQDTVYRLRGEHPKMEYSLAIFRRHYELPTSSTLGIFALGRIIGWIGHAIKQYRSKQTIQPRIRYTGPTPQRQA
jgi:citrate synthase